MSAEGKDHGSRGEMSPEERDAIKRRSDDLGRRLDQARHREAPQAGRGAAAVSSKSDAMARAFRVSAELIGGIVVGSLIGWYLDGWLGNQKPWFFILFFMLGAAAGILNVIRMAMREQTPKGLRSVADDQSEDK